MPELSSLRRAARRLPASWRGAARAAYHAARAQPGLLEPILVRMLFGRVGSTLVMQVLATAPEISFDREYPFEHRCLANLLHYLDPLRSETAARTGWWLEESERVLWIEPSAWGFEVAGQPLNYPNLGVDRAEVHLGAVRGVWQAYSDAARRASPAPLRYYAEKYSGYAEVLIQAGIPFRVLDIVRDPRDVWASIQAFDAKRGYYGFGRREGQSDEEYLRGYTTAVGLRLEEMAQPLAGVPALRIRYEDLIADLPGETGRLAGWLGLALDPDQVAANRPAMAHHLTSDSVGDSVGRWRREITAEAAAYLEAELAGHLDRLGYPRSRRC